MSSKFADRSVLARDIIIKPVVSEKSYALLDQNTYTFVVHPKANKIQIRDAVKTIFDVTVVGVRTDTRPGKPRRMGWSQLTTPHWKRAIVTLKAGQSIDVY